MTTQEKIEVMKAYAEGKTIQARNRGEKLWADWNDEHEPNWNWELVNFRIKPESEYRPYRNTMEMIDDYCDRFKVDINKNIGCPLIWVKSKSSKVAYLVTAFESDKVFMALFADTMQELFDQRTYLDGSPCGMKEEA